MIFVYLIICLCGGDFCYSDGEFVVIFEDVCMVCELGFSGLVMGVFDVDGNVDMLWMEKIMVAVGLLVVIFYCVFDMCVNFLYIFNNFVELGIVWVLILG